MYLITELILFSPLIIYAGIQVRKLIPRSGLKNIFVLFYILLFFGYPLAELFSHRDTGSWAHHPMLVGYYCLPYLLYITLSVAAIDLGISLGRIIKLLRPEAVSGAGFRSLRLGCYLLLPAVIVAAGALNNNRLQIKKLSVELPRKSSSLTKLNIVFASDFHLSGITNDHLIRRFVAKVNAEHPDIVLIGGDVLEGHGDHNLNRFEKQFREIQSKYGAYAAPGNHESRRAGAGEFFQRSGIRFLEDGVEKIDNAFYLVIRKDGRFSRRKSIDGLLKAAPEDLPIILVDHRPTEIENVSNSRVNLQFSGHTHNGQLFPINLVIMPFEYELAWGTMIRRNTIFIVSSGVQAWGPPVKTAGDSEILSVQVQFGGTSVKGSGRF
jgi:predicted MPP superfamily phosphohydrolase